MARKVFIEMRIGKNDLIKIKIYRIYLFATKSPRFTACCSRKSRRIVPYEMINAKNCNEITINVIRIIQTFAY